MKSRNEFVSLYKNVIRPALHSLEEERKKVRTQISATVLIVLGVSVLFFLKNPSPITLKLIFFIGPTICFFAYQYFLKPFKRKYKQKIVKRVLSEFIDELKYYPKKFVSKDEFLAGELNKREISEFCGDDLCVGDFKGIKTRFCELVVSSGTGKNKVVTYRGLFFRFDLDIDFKSKTIIRRDIAENLFGSLGRKLQKLGSQKGYSLIELESSEFEKTFAIHSNDQVRSRVILNPKTMSLLTNLYKNKQRDIEVSLVGKHVYVQLPHKKNYFEPKIFGKTNSWEEFKDIYEIFLFIQGLIACLSIDSESQKAG